MKGNSKRTSGNSLSSLEARKQGSRRSFADVTNQGYNYVRDAGYSKEARFRTVFPIIFSKSNPINRAPDGTTESGTKC